ncbi:protein of unknown function [Candidatus Nitrosocaldus cavascurensis]|uniref:Uncharacterized protein n=1 Tax=Candidatus Nitrosocaldus cavascurensis TaxID=2058097 RepID=A0A2K5ARA9_9ARCH|nr:protein of unknown function [Candidatus Nitrosocaldus cavascurensis]
MLLQRRYRLETRIGNSNSKVTVDTVSVYLDASTCVVKAVRYDEIWL